MSSPQESEDQQKPGGSVSAGSGDTAPRNATRFETLGDAHRCIVGQSTSDVAEPEFLKDASVHSDDVEEEESQDTLSLAERKRLEQQWFDEAFLAASTSDEPPSGEEVPVSAGEDTATSSGFNQALVTVGTVGSNRSASLYRAAPDLVRREGAVARIGFRDDESSGAETVSAQIRAQADSDGPSLPLPTDPPRRPAQTNNAVFPDPSVSSVTNSQALLQGALSSPPARAYQPGHRPMGRNLSSIAQPLLRPGSARDRPRTHRSSLPQFAALFGTDRQTSRFYDVGEGDDWQGPGPAIVRGAIRDAHARDINALSPDLRQSTLTVPQGGASASTSRSASGGFESSGSSGQDPFHYDRIFLPSEQERVVNSRLRTMTGNATVFSQSPLNSPERADEYHDIPLDDGPETPSRPSSSRRQQATTFREADRQLAVNEVRANDNPTAPRTCNYCRLPSFECDVCVDRRRLARESQRQRDNGPYAPSPSYRMDSRGVRVAGQDSGDPAFYIGTSPERRSSTEPIVARRDPDALPDSPTLPTRGLERSDFSTFRPVQRTHRVNGRDESSLDVPSFSQLRQRRPTLDSYLPAPAAFLGGTASNRSRFEFRDSFGEREGDEQVDGPQPGSQHPGMDGWRALSTHQDGTTTSQSTDLDRRATNWDIEEADGRNRAAVSSPYSTDPSSSTPFSRLPFSLVPRDEFARQQAEMRSRGEMDQTFISASTAPRRTAIPGSSGDTATQGRRTFSSTLRAQAERAQQRTSDLLHGRRPPRGGAVVRRTTGRRDSFTSVMRVALEEYGALGAEATPRAFVAGQTTTTPAVNSNSDGTLPPTLLPPPRTFPRSSRYGNIRDEDIELAPYGMLATQSISMHCPGTTALGRRWSA